jgi:hypothetical protein
VRGLQTHHPVPPLTAVKQSVAPRAIFLNLKTRTMPKTRSGTGLPSAIIRPRVGEKLRFRQCSRRCRLPSAAQLRPTPDDLALLQMKIPRSLLSNVLRTCNSPRSRPATLDFQCKSGADEFDVSEWRAECGVLRRYASCDGIANIKESARNMQNRAVGDNERWGAADFGGAL